jgi:hypothetical protein
MPKTKAKAARQAAARLAQESGQLQQFQRPTQISEITNTPGTSKGARKRARKAIEKRESQLQIERLLELAKASDLSKAVFGQPQPGEQPKSPKKIEDTAKVEYRNELKRAEYAEHGEPLVIEARTIKTPVARIRLPRRIDPNYETRSLTDILFRSPRRWCSL